MSRWVGYALIAVAAPWGRLASGAPALVLVRAETSMVVPWFPKRSSTA